MRESDGSVRRKMIRYTYMDKQMYHLMLEGAGDNTTEIYAQADGTLLPLNAQSTPEGTGGGANGGSTNKG